MITAYRHFGLSAAPFEGTPDPRFFYRSPSHGEALATLQFAVTTGKACTVALGDSGSGKTLLGRLLVRSLGRQTGVLWVHGIGQPDHETQVTVCLPGSLADSDNFAVQRIEEASLTGWIRSHLARSPATVLVVDNADALPHHGWSDVLSIVTRELRSAKPVSVVLFGLPSLMHLLTQPDLLRLRRRIFRTCHIARLTRVDTAEYVLHRLRMAGAADPAAVFTSSALDLVHRFSDGNPALINQICDNAMVDAFSDDVQQVDVNGIVATIQAITGRTVSFPPAAPPRALGRPEERAPRVVPQAAEPTPDKATSDQQPAAPAEVLTGTPAQDAPSGGAAEVLAASTAATVGVAESAADPLGGRLRVLENRLSDSLARIRQARTRPDLPVFGADVQPGLDASDVSHSDVQVDPQDVSEAHVATSDATDPEPAE